MTPRTIIEAALVEKFQDSMGRTGRVAPAPPLSREEIEQFDRSLPGPLPGAIRDLLGFARGFRLLGERVDFRGEIESEFQLAFSCGLPIYTNGYGAFWTVYVQPETGSWGPVLFISEDPPVLVVQSKDLADFLTELFNAFRAEGISAVNGVFSLALDVWRQGKGLRAVSEIRDSPDPILRAFVRDLRDDVRIADLRGAGVGSGFT